MKIAAVALALLATSTTALAQQRDQPAAQVAPPPSGTAVLTGTVTESPDATTPVRRAILTLLSNDGKDSRSTVSDEQGRFAFDGLPAGRYSLTADKPAYLKNSYGAKHPGRPGVAIAIADGQVLTDLRMVLPRGGVVTGVVRLASGEPLRDTPVIAVPVAEATAGGQTFGTTEFSTDDRGVYRIYGLTPGDYIVGALPTLGRGEVQVRTASDYEAAVRTMNQLATRSPNQPPPTPPDPGPLLGYAPTYFPGTPVSAQAAAVTVGPGDVRDGIDIPVTMFRMGRISGTVIGVDGQPRRAAQLTVDGEGPPLPIRSALTIRVPPPDADGHFTITNVPPGHYRVRARSGGMTISADGSSRSINTNNQTDWALADVQVNGDHVEGVTLRLQPGLTFAGRISLDGTTDTPANPLSSVRIAVQPLGASGQNIIMNGSPLSGNSGRNASVTAEGVFEVTGIEPGNYELRVTLPSTLSREWAVRSVTANGRDVRDAPLTFDTGSITGVTLSLTNQRTEVTGTLSSASGTPATDYYVVIFAADRTLWHPVSPRVAVIRPGADGVFSVRDLPAGEYRLAALTDVADDEVKQRAFLDSLLTASIPVVVTDGQTTRQDIRIR